MPHLLNVWPSIIPRLRDAPQVLLLFDYDGTLTPIVSHPDLAILHPKSRELLQNLCRKDKYLLGVISGRSLADVRDKVGIPDMIYAGNHGLEIQGPGLEFIHPEAVRSLPLLDQIYIELQVRLAGYAGVMVEHKGLTLSVHNRSAPDTLVGNIEETFTDCISGYLASDQVKTTRGKRVLEVRPNVEWHKGMAIKKVQDTFTEASLTVFFGDDLTDEDGFQVVQKSGGLAVFVGDPRQPTRALHRVDSPQEVLETLRLLAQL